jgi:2-polyprenyl-6-methoxyphenol hydroxylase-like FAD-dependent oxidoreductase
MAYWFIDRIPTDGCLRETYNARDGRMIMRRSHNPTETQVYFMLRDGSSEASEVHERPVEQQKAFWARKFRDAGWQAERFLEGMRNAEFFYSQEAVQVRIDKWFKGRMVLVGDAAHCASPFSGMGVSGSLVGAYVLAGEITRHGNNLTAALETYESVMRPFVKEIQTVKPFLLRIGIPTSQWQIELLHSVTAWACRWKLLDLVASFAKDRGGDWKAPDYARSSVDRQDAAPDERK